jgi:hypothetical protein
MYIFAPLKKKVLLQLYILRDRAGVARWAHNPKVGCSNHSPATPKTAIEKSVAVFHLNQNRSENSCTSYKPRYTR